MCVCYGTSLPVHAFVVRFIFYALGNGRFYRFHVSFLTYMSLIIFLKGSYDFVFISFRFKQVLFARGNVEQHTSRKENKLPKIVYVALVRGDANMAPVSQALELSNMFSLCFAVGT